LTYFCCDRAASILRTLIQQLAQTASEDEFITPVLDIYTGLTLKERQDLLVQPTAVYPQMTICIDALGEVDHKLQLESLEVLAHVAERSNTLATIFATTRMDTDILVQFEMFPRTELEPDGNVDDINRFVKEKVQSTIE